MTPALYAPGHRPYGASELKRGYQGNVALALLLAVALHFAAIGGGGLYHHLTYVAPTAAKQVTRMIDSTVIVASIIHRIVRPDVGGGSGLDQPGDRGIPKAVPDEEVSDESLTLHWEPRLLHHRGTDTASTGPGRAGEGSPGLGAIPDTDFRPPPPHTHVSYDKPPEAVYLLDPAYPEFAQRAGLEAFVIIRVYIDDHGHVHDPFVVRCTAPDLGFEEAALAAVARWKFKPAIQSGHNIGVWY